MTGYQSDGSCFRMLLGAMSVTQFLAVGHISTLIEKAKCIFNTIIDDGGNGVTVSTVITHLAKFGENWEKCPKSAADIRVTTADKLRSHSPKYEFP